LEDHFNTLINGYIENKVGVAEFFIPDILATQLRKHLLDLQSLNELQSAGTGNQKIALQDKSIRGDLIYWLDRKHNNFSENAFLDLIDQFILHLNRTCYTGITGYEFHYALYPAGSFYIKHKDQFRDTAQRQYTMIFYLNEDWISKDGGQLCIHHYAHTENIDPLSGRCVFFKSSELEHEVLLAHKARMSITG
jgi:SM-20-related protein